MFHFPLLLFKQKIIYNKNELNNINNYKSKKYFNYEYIKRDN
jgi:hypothetical protein